VYKRSVESRPPDESTLVARARRGEAAAYEELVRMHQAVAFRVALVHAGDPADAEEAVQDGFVKAYRALGRFREGAPFRPWLLRIVANEARNRRRAAGRRAGMTLRVAGAAASGDAAPSPEAAALDGERRAELLEALGRLDERDRDVLVHRFLLGLDEQEAAESLGVRRGTVKSRTSRALDRLRTELPEVTS
jgi:RNA polymerase sigma-70 factor (ECF subfamily)